MPRTMTLSSFSPLLASITIRESSHLLPCIHHHLSVTIITALRTRGFNCWIQCALRFLSIGGPQSEMCNLLIAGRGCMNGALCALNPLSPGTEFSPHIDGFILTPSASALGVCPLQKALCVRSQLVNVNPHSSTARPNLPPVPFSVLMRSTILHFRSCNIHSVQRRSQKSQYLRHAPLALSATHPAEAQELLHHKLASSSLAAH